MHPRIKEVHDYLVSAHVHLKDAVDAVPPDARDRQPSPDRWSVTQVIEHLAAVDTRIAALFAKTVAQARADGIGADPETTTILWTMDVARVMDRSERIEAAEAIRPEGERKWSDAWAARGAAPQTLGEAGLAGGGVDLGRISSPHRIFGPLNFYQWGAFAAAHEMRHAQQIREIAGALAVAAR
jgi:hypothetical protein